jgi:hypothetical protein
MATQRDKELDIGRVMTGNDEEPGCGLGAVRDAVDLASDQDQETWITEDGKRIACIVPASAAEYALKPVLAAEQPVQKDSEIDVTRLAWKYDLIADAIEQAMKQDRTTWLHIDGKRIACITPAGAAGTAPWPPHQDLAWHEGTHLWMEHDGYPSHLHAITGALTIGQDGHAKVKP